MRFDRAVCGNLASALEREWLETNGLGGFASSTIIGLNTRRYHGLVIAALKPPVERYVLLSKVEETAVVGGRRYDLSANQYPGVIYPSGYEYLKEFRLDPYPVFTYEIEGVEIEKHVCMVHGESTTVIEYLANGPCLLEVRPLLAFRGCHSLAHWNDSLNRTLDMSPGLASITPYAGLPSLFFAHNATDVEATGDWYYNFEYLEEQRRGLEYREDLFNPLVARFDLQREPAAIIASIERRKASQAGDLRRAEVERRRLVAAAAPRDEPLVRALAAAADQFIVRRGELKTIIAGYHWFGDWGRDTMISIPGLTLVTGRAEVTKEILLAYAGSVDRGMLPNRFSDAGETPEYNAVDATLWFFEAVAALLRHNDDFPFVRENLYETLKEIISWHMRGTRYGIGVDADGLLRSGEPGLQLTWMDAKVGDWVVTPRHGKPVEIQALWYNALRIMECLARQYSDAAAGNLYRDVAEQARTSFADAFWNEEAGCLYDVVNGVERDGSIRPNQIFAVSLRNALLEDERARKVVEVVQRELMTPLGLRTLSPRDACYRGRYEGGVRKRDSAYHQGAVWPWLLGPFISAYVKVNNRSEAALAQASNWLGGFEEHLKVAGLGQISEIADGDLPHTPRGCIAQAWSVAELLRAAVEETG